MTLAVIPFIARINNSMLPCPFFLLVPRHRRCCLLKSGHRHGKLTSACSDRKTKISARASLVGAGAAKRSWWQLGVW